MNTPLSDIIEEVRKTDLGQGYDGYRILLYRGEERLRDGLTLESYGIVSSCTLYIHQGPSLGRCLLGVPNLPSVVRKLNPWSKKHVVAPNIVAAQVVVCKGWDGKMMEPWIGLPLEEGMIISVLYLVTIDWCYGYRESEAAIKGFFPRAHVRYSSAIPGFDLGEDHDFLPSNYSTPFDFASLQVIDPSFAPRNELHSFKIHLGDEGQSFIAFELLLHPPSDLASNGPSQIDVFIKPWLIPPRRVTCVVLDLNFLGNKVIEATPSSYIGEKSEQTVITETRRSASLGGGGSFGGLSLNLSTSGELGEKIESTRITCQEITAVPINDAVRWSLQEDVGQGGKHGVPFDQPLSAFVSFHPGLVEYRCQVKHAADLNGKARTHIVQGFHRFRPWL
ncbi:hypothetical protein ONZ45_g16319 [Pleurotus djamor]|nr:hypothetical protein ONZ45_g16319 [Pleurotus djamor]